MQFDDFNIYKQFKLIEERGWDKLYVAVDLHDTAILSDYSNTKPITFAPNAKEVLQMLSNSNKINLILFTCSYDKHIVKYLDFFKDNGITFEQINKNEEVPNTEYADFSNKFYYNILLDDKAGFKCDRDWYILEKVFKQHL